jgi:thymidylate kinase
MALPRGAFVVVIGPDGVGKTTLAARLIEDHGSPTMYLHFRPRLLTRPPSSPVEGDAPPPKRSDPGPPPSGWLRLARSVAMFWLGYLRWIKPALARGTLVVGDRWAFGYVGQPAALGFAGPSWLARLAVRLVPQPDLVLRLRGDPGLVAGRKGDLAASQIELEDRLWDSIPIGVYELDASNSVDDLAKAVSRRLFEQVG